MKFVVVVNQKYIVSVDAESNGGAEHRILDNFSGIDGAQAFGQKELNTEYFGYFLENCKMVSLQELGQISKRYEESWKDYASANDNVIAAKRRIEELKKELEEAKIEAHNAEVIAKDKYEFAMATAKNIGHRM